MYKYIAGAIWEIIIKTSWYWVFTIIPGILTIVGGMQNYFPENPWWKFMIYFYSHIPVWMWFIITAFCFAITILVGAANYIKRHSEKFQPIIVPPLENQSGGLRAKTINARDFYDGGIHIHHSENNKSENARRIFPNIGVDSWFVGNSAYITIQNNETVALENTSVRIIDFRYNDSSNDVESFSKTKGFSVGLIEIERKIIPNSPPINVLIARGMNLKYTEFFTDDEYHKHIQDLQENRNSSWNKYHMIFQVYGQLVDEKENRLLGTYSGQLIHTNYFPQKEGQVIVDNLTWTSFEKINA